MAFGQQAGPPATARQVQELVELVQAAGHADLRDARGALGLTQRQAAGKFTRDEADVLIAQLQEAEHAADGPPPAVAEPVARLRATTDQRLRGIASEQLAAELQRRGWVVMEP